MEKSFLDCSQCIKCVDFFSFFKLRDWSIDKTNIVQCLTDTEFYAQQSLPV